MLKIFVKQWDKNKDILRDKLVPLSMRRVDYDELVKVAFDVIYNQNNESLGRGLDTEHITVIDNGEYQGTLLFLIPFDTYQPSESEYLLTYVGYGSCSGCDTLQWIYDYTEGKKQVDELLSLCKDIITNTIRPYNTGWRQSEDFEIATV